MASVPTSTQKIQGLDSDSDGFESLLESLSSKSFTMTGTICVGKGEPAWGTPVFSGR